MAKIIIVAVVIVILLGAAFAIFMHLGVGGSPSVTSQQSPSSSGAAPLPVSSVPAASGQSVTTPSGVSFSYTASYGLAVNQSQVLVRSSVPPCVGGFDYCLYRVADNFSDTNFDSAGLAITERKDMGDQTRCLMAQPVGFTGLTARVNQGGAYATSAFGPFSNNAAGHLVDEAEYRLWTGSTCEQFDLLIAKNDFNNYPADTVLEFTAADEAAVAGEMRAVLNSALLHGQQVTFP